MYNNLMVAVDNSACSNNAVDLAVNLARTMGARLTATHVYAARLHDERFRQMEPGLPDRYQSAEMLDRQRTIHDDLIGRGLKIISDSYLTVIEEKCRTAGVVAECKATEGRNYEQLVRDIRVNGYDLVLIGAHGLGRVEHSVLGSVCERVARLVDCDVLVVRDGRPLDQGKLLVAIDGSAHAFAALAAALDLSKVYSNQVEAVAAYDPFFHSAAFKGVAGVLSEENARLFRFQEQEKLHDQIIDHGLMEVYRAHLIRAQKEAQLRGQDLEITVLEGKPFGAIARHAAERRPALLLAGRLGIHHGEGITLGSTVENLLRCVECNVLVVNRDAQRRMKEQESGTTTARADVRWTAEAERRLERVPWFARKMARRGIERYARDKGYDEITLGVYDQARQHLGP